MAHDEMLADRIRQMVAGEAALTEQRMFGGLAFLVSGNLAVAASGQGGLMVRIDPADAHELTQQDHVERMEMRGRAMDGWLRVAQPALQDDAALRGWVETGLAYARTLPAK